MIDDFIKNLRKKWPFLGLIATIFVILLFIIDAAEKFQSLNALSSANGKIFWAALLSLPLVFGLVVSKNEHFRYS